MSCILTKTTGRTSPNTRLPSRASNNSLDSHCMKKERSDENVSHRILAGTDWKHRARGRPRWIVAALSRGEADGGCRNQTGEFLTAGFYGQLDVYPACIDGSAIGSGANLAAAVAEHRGEDWQGRTKIGRRRDSHHRQCRCGRKAAGLRPSAVLWLYSKSICRRYIPIRP